jgi:hypothetical protein
MNAEAAAKKSPPIPCLQGQPSVGGLASARVEE